MTWPAIAAVVLVLVVLFSLHKFLLWMEQRGWIYYWHNRGSTGMGNAVLPIQELFQPEIRYTVQERTRQHVDPLP